MLVAAGRGEELTVFTESQIVNGLAATGVISGNNFFPVLSDDQISHCGACSYNEPSLL